MKFKAIIGAHWWEAPDAYRQVSPSTYAANITTPLLTMDLARGTKSLFRNVAPEDQNVEVEWHGRTIKGKVHMRDLHATLLYALGLDHEKLTYRYAGRNFRLTDVAGTVVHDLFA